MNESHKFYRLQEEWGGVYSGEVTAWHRHRAQRVRSVLGQPPKQVLELGAGGGQDAVALAEQGDIVVALEREPLLVAHLRHLLREHPTAQVRVVEADFYQADLPEGAFDAVCYWDGFGVGTDEDQRRLLRRVRYWLRPGGLMLVDVYTPWHAAKSAGHRMRIGKAERTYAFDAHRCRWIDTWRMADEHVTQSWRCYSPADLRLLLEGVGLEIIDVQPGGAMDYATGRFQAEAPLLEAMWYTAVLKA